MNILQEGTVIEGGFGAIVDEIIRSDADIVFLEEIRNYNGIQFVPRLIAALAAKGAEYFAGDSSTDTAVLSKYPLDKLLGEKDFYKYRFKVSEDVLSPRPDTEVLVEAAVRLVSEQKLQTVLDMGTGSGCIILSLLAEFENLTGAAIDISEKALEIAKENARRLGISNRIKFYHQSWFNEKLEQVLGERYDMVVSNPPYIATSEIDWLERDVKDHDPRLALDGGDDGYKHYRQIAKAAYGLLKQGGYILLEGGINQAEEIRKIFENENFEHKETCMDLAGIKRCIILKK